MFHHPLLKNTAIYSGSNILNSFIPFLLLPILTRVLLPAEYGILAMFQATLGMMGAFTGLSVHGAVSSRYFDRELIDYPRYIGSCLFILLISSLLSLAVVFFFRTPFSAFTSLPYFWLMIAVLASFCNFLIQIRLVLWLMAQKALRYGLFQVSFSATNVGLSLVFVLLMKQGYEGRLWGELVAFILFSSIGLAGLIWAGSITLRPRWKYVREALGFGLPLVPHVIGIFLISMFDRFIINHQLGLAAAGLYMAAVQLGSVLGKFTDAFNKAYVPWLYKKLKDDNPFDKQRIVKYTWIYFGTILIVASILALLSRWIIYLIAGPVYTPAAKALAWLFFGQAFAGMYLMVTNFIFYRRKTLILPIITIVSGGIGVTLTWFLAPVFGITAAGFSFLVAMSVRFLMTWRCSQWVCPMPWFAFTKLKST